jgi:hypothetical protein
MTAMQIDRAVVEQALEVLEDAKALLNNKDRTTTMWFADEITALRAALAQEQAEPLTIERLRYALVASRIIPPAAVEDPDEYDDGVTLHRIEALHRRLT